MGKADVLVVWAKALASQIASTTSAVPVAPDRPVHARGIFINQHQFQERSALTQDTSPTFEVSINQGVSKIVLTFSRIVAFGFARHHFSNLLANGSITSSSKLADLVVPP